MTGHAGLGHRLGMAGAEVGVLCNATSWAAWVRVPILRRGGLDGQKWKKSFPTRFNPEQTLSMNQWSEVIVSEPGSHASRPAALQLQSESASCGGLFKTDCPGPTLGVLILFIQVVFPFREDLLGSFSPDSLTNIGHWRPLLFLTKVTSKEFLSCMASEKALQNQTALVWIPALPCCL